MWIIAIIAEIILDILACVIVMWFSRRREFHADAVGAGLTGRHKMIAVLQGLKCAHGQPQLPDQLAAFGINGVIGAGIKRLLMTHPSLDERIAVLKQSAFSGV